MTDMGMAGNLKRAARFNPAWKPATIYRIATNQIGEGVTDATGTFLYDLVEGTFGRLAFDTENRQFLDESPYQGHAIICVITGTEPNPMGMIQLGETYYQVTEVIAADALGATIRYRGSAITGTVPSIRTGP